MEITPNDFTEWMAAHQLDGVLGDEKTQAILALIGTRLLRMLGDKDVQPADLIPGSENDKTKSGSGSQEIKATPNQAAMLVTSWAARNGLK